MSNNERRSPNPGQRGKPKKLQISKDVHDIHKEVTVFDESPALRRMATLFIAPLLKYKKMTESVLIFLDRVFCIKERRIDLYVVKHSFDLVGSPWSKVWVRALTKTVRIRQAIKIFVRYDSTTPRTYEFEVIDKQDPAKSVIYDVASSKATIYIHRHLRKKVLKGITRRPRKYSWEYNDK